LGALLLHGGRLAKMTKDAVVGDVPVVAEADAPIFENPLVNHAKLRQMYEAMLGARLLAERVVAIRKSRQRKAKADASLLPTIGQEACRVSSAIELLTGDLVSDTQPGVVTPFLLGAKVKDVLKPMETGKPNGRIDPDVPGARVMPFVADGTERLHLALGAGLAAKTANAGRVVVVYMAQREIERGVLRRVLRLAAKLELPMVFVVLPRAAGEKKGPGVAGMNDRSSVAGVPGIPVDASDAVALYRVSQESIGRARGGDGPALIECISYQRAKRASDVDPVAAMSAYVLAKKAGTQAWLDEAQTVLRKRIGAAKG